MASVSESETSVLEPHIPSGEHLVESFTGEERTVAVTDRRVMELEHEASDRAQDTTLESVLLTSDYIVGTEYSNDEDTDPPLVEYFAAGLLLFIGAGGGLVGFQTGSVAFYFGCVILLILGGLILALTQSRESGEVTVTVHRAGDLSDCEWEFPRGETEVAQAITEQVAELNKPT